MGVFDTMNGYVICPNCSHVNYAEIQFKWLDPMMANYTIGDYIDGHESYAILDEDDTKCRACQAEFMVYAIGHFGYLYGFANEIQLEKIKPFLHDQENPSSTIQLVIAPSIKGNSDAIFKAFKQSFATQPDAPTHFLGFAKEDISVHVCRMNSQVAINQARPKVGDVVYFDNRRSRYQPWELIDEPFTVEEATLIETTQLFSYTIKSANYRFKAIAETQVVFEAERTKKKNELNGYIQTIKNAANGVSSKSFDSFHLKMHGCALVNYLKENGEIPQDFVL